MYIFNGTQVAAEKLALLQDHVSALKAQGTVVKIASVLFVEDSGSRLYAGIKQEQASKVGIQYELHSFSLTDDVELVKQTVEQLNTDNSVMGIIIQKPWKKTWITFQTPNSKFQNYDEWWNGLYNCVDVSKDVDGLHPITIEAIQAGTWLEQGRVLPATCQAVLETLAIAEKNTNDTGKVIIIGKSDLVGIPLAAVLRQQGREVELLGKQELENRKQSGKLLLDADVIVSATGVKQLITGKMIKEGSIVIDVGEPRPDVDYESVAPKTAFLTPVPGGIGPLTIACLLENAVKLTEVAE